MKQTTKIVAFVTKFLQEHEVSDKIIAEFKQTCKTQLEEALKAKSPHVARPLTSYQIFCAEKRSELKDMGLNSREIMCRLGAMWQEHKLQNPDLAVKPKPSKSKTKKVIETESALEHVPVEPEKQLSVKIPDENVSVKTVTPVKSRARKSSKPLEPIVVTEIISPVVSEKKPLEPIVVTEIISPVVSEKKPRVKKSVKAPDNDLDQAIIAAAPAKRTRTKKTIIVSDDSE